MQHLKCSIFSGGAWGWEDGPFETNYCVTRFIHFYIFHIYIYIYIYIYGCPVGFHVAGFPQRFVLLRQSAKTRFSERVDISSDTDDRRCALHLYHIILYINIHIYIIFHIYIYIYIAISLSFSLSLSLSYIYIQQKLT